MNEEEIKELAEELGTRRTKYVVAPKHVIELHLTINYMQRVKPSDPWDSGWRFLHGNETDEMLDRKDEIFNCYNPSEVLYEGNEVIFKYLDSPVGSAFVREGDDFVSCGQEDEAEPQVIALVTKDTTEVKTLLAEQYDLGAIKTKLSRERYIDFMTEKISNSPQLIYDEVIDTIQDSITKRKNQIETEKRRKLEEERRREKDERELKDLMLMTAPFAAMLAFVAIGNTVLYFRNRYFVNGRTLFDGFSRTFLSILIVICLACTLIYLLVDPLVKNKELHMRRKGVMFGILSILCILLGKVI